VWHRDLDGAARLDEQTPPTQRRRRTTAGRGPATERKYDKAALATLQRLEVAMVKADLACAEKHIAPVEDPVRKEFERTFAEQNAAFLATVPRA